MKRTVVGVIVAALAVGAIIAVVAMNGKKDDSKKSNDSMADMSSDSANSSNNSSDSSSESSAPASSSSSVEVEIDDFAFQPATLTVKKGTKVTWTNKDSASHNVMSDDSNGPKSDTLEQGDSFSFTFDTAGTFNYICSFHPNMTAKVVVTE